MSDLSTNERRQGPGTLERAQAAAAQVQAAEERAQAATAQARAAEERARAAAAQARAAEERARAVEREREHLMAELARMRAEVADPSSEA